MWCLGAVRLLKWSGQTRAASQGTFGWCHPNLSLPWLCFSTCNWWWITAAICRLFQLADPILGTSGTLCKTEPSAFLYILSQRRGGKMTGEVVRSIASYLTCVMRDSYFRGSWDNYKGTPISLQERRCCLPTRSTVSWQLSGCWPLQDLSQLLSWGQALFSAAPAHN